MSDDSWWDAQRILHDRLEAASSITDAEEREDARISAWDWYKRELGQ